MSENSWVIWDKELENLLENWQDKLWTTKYVDQLFDIITNLSKDELEKWFNIWLYWWWWSGKSTIARALEKKIEYKCNNEIKVIYLDCRKYCNDDLRRSILLEIWKLYKNSKLTEKIEQEFYFDKSKGEEREEIDINLLKKICIIGIPLLIIMWVLKELWAESSILEVICWSSIAFLVIKTLIDLISKRTIIWKIWRIISNIDIPKIWNYNIKDLIPTIKVSQSISEWKIFSWEQFENLFKILIWRESAEFYQFEDIKGIVGKNNLFKDKKILFIFDNIDRCEPDIVKEILMTIKTFLNQDDCIFLLPIDYENVCISYKTYDQWDEYLRKIFNLWINLKPPYCTKFSNLIQDLLKWNWWQNQGEKELWLTDNDVNEISYILSSTFADNPRKIKQFLNQLWAEYLLHNKAKNILSILKELIIQVELPNLYKYLSEDQNILFANEKFEKFVSSDTPLKDWNGKKIELSPRQRTILHKLLWIKEKLELLDSEDMKMEKLYHQSPENFIQVIKNDSLEKQVESFLLWNIESTRLLSNIEQIELLEKSIYYMAEFWTSETFFNRLFEEWSEFSGRNTLNIISSIDFKILYKFLATIWNKYINKLPQNFKETFTDRLIINLDQEIDEFKNLDKNLQNLLINRNIILKYHNEEVENENFKEHNYFKFLQNFPVFITENYVKTIFKDIDYNSFDFSQIKSNNLIHILSIMKKYSDTLLENINTICKKFIEQDQHFIRNYEWINKKEVDLFLECAKIIIINWDNENLHDKLVSKLVDLYNWYPNSSFSEKLYNIFLEEFLLREPYKRPYADIIIDKNNINYINKMIDGTSNEWEDRLWLENQHIEKIIDKISREDDNWNNIIQSIRKNNSIKNILFNRINWLNDDDEKFSKIKKLDTLNILTEKDKESFWNEFTSKLKTWLESWSIENMGKTCNFIKEYHNSNIMKYIDYPQIQTLLKKFDIDYFKWQLMADIFEWYKNMRSEALKNLRNIKMKFGNDLYKTNN